MQTSSLWNRYGWTFVLPLALSACAVGNDFKRPAVPTASTYLPAQSMPQETVAVHIGEAQHFNAASALPADWWTLFQSPQLNTLIQRALQANPSVGAAQAALRATQQNALAQAGFFYPTVGVGYSPSRNKLAGNMGGNSPGVQGDGTVVQTYSNAAGPAPFNAPAYYNFHVAQLTVGYAPDVFGLNQRLLESAEAQSAVQQMQLEATYLTLSSNVVAAAVQEAAIRAQLKAQQKIIALSQDTLDIVRRQASLGAVSGLEVAAQQGALAAAQQALAPLQKQLALTRDVLRTLLGITPDTELSETFELSDLHLPTELPLSLPAKLVEQRPDVRAAEATLHFASAQAGVAQASRLPQFAVTGAIGGMATTPDWMFRHGGGFFNLAASVAQTLFDGGTLRAKSRAAEQTVLQAAAQYRGTVMLALQNVADTLYTLQSDADTLKFAAAQTQAAQAMFELTQKQYRLGAVGYAAQLAAEQSYQQTLINLAQAQSNRLGDTALLYQALGGGWWNRHAATDAVTPSLAAGDTP